MEDPSWYALETILDRSSWSQSDNSWRVTRAALRTDGYRSQRLHKFEGETVSRALEVEPVTAWGSAALDTLLRSSEAPFGAFITCNRLGLLLPDPVKGSKADGSQEPQLAMLDGQKTRVLYLQFTTYGQILRRS